MRNDEASNMEQKVVIGVTDNRVTTIAGKCTAKELKQQMNELREYLR